MTGHAVLLLLREHLLVARRHLERVRQRARRKGPLLPPVQRLRLADVRLDEARVVLERRVGVGLRLRVPLQLQVRLGAVAVQLA